MIDSYPIHLTLAWLGRADAEGEKLANVHTSFFHSQELRTQHLIGRILKLYLNCTHGGSMR
jgi:hypothetical protein